MGRFVSYKSFAHADLAKRERRSYHQFSTSASHAHTKPTKGMVASGRRMIGGNPGTVTFIINTRDFRRLQLGLAEIGPTMHHVPILRVAMYRTLRVFKNRIYQRLKVWTGMRRGFTRLNKGVHIYTTEPWLRGVYVIKDRYLSITKTYFDAKYSPYGIPGGRARWGLPFSPAGATHYAWGSAHLVKKSFMIPGKDPVFIRPPGSKRFPIGRVWGPNPAKEVARHEGEVKGILVAVAKTYFVPFFERAYTAAVMRAKAHYGL